MCASPPLALSLSLCLSLSLSCALSLQGHLRPEAVDLERQMGVGLDGVDQRLRVGRHAQRQLLVGEASVLLLAHDADEAQGAEDLCVTVTSSGQIAQRLKSPSGTESTD